MGVKGWGGVGSLRPPPGALLDEKQQNQRKNAKKQSSKRDRTVAIMGLNARTTATERATGDDPPLSPNKIELTDCFDETVAGNQTSDDKSMTGADCEHTSTCACGQAEPRQSSGEGRARQRQQWSEFNAPRQGALAGQTTQKSAGTSKKQRNKRGHTMAKKG